MVLLFNFINIPVLYISVAALPPSDQSYTSVWFTSKSAFVRMKPLRDIKLSLWLCKSWPITTISAFTHVWMDYEAGHQHVVSCFLFLFDSFCMSCGCVLYLFNFEVVLHIWHILLLFLCCQFESFVVDLHPFIVAWCVCLCCLFSSLNKFYWLSFQMLINEPFWTWTQWADPVISIIFCAL